MMDAAQLPRPRYVHDDPLVIEWWTITRAGRPYFAIRLQARAPYQMWSAAEIARRSVGDDLAGWRKGKSDGVPEFIGICTNGPDGKIDGIGSAVPQVVNGKTIEPHGLLAWLQQESERRGSSRIQAVRGANADRWLAWQKRSAFGVKPVGVHRVRGK